MAKKKQEAKAPDKQMVEIPRERVLEGIKEAVKEMLKMMREAKAKYGIHYNTKNEYEVFCRRFDTNDVEKILQEFDLIRAKQSQQPSVIRSVIKQLGENAFRYCYMMWRKEQEEKKQEQEQGASKE